MKAIKERRDMDKDLMDKLRDQLIAKARDLWDKTEHCIVIELSDYVRVVKLKEKDGGRRRNLVLVSNQDVSGVVREVEEDDLTSTPPE